MHYGKWNTVTLQKFIQGQLVCEYIVYVRFPCLLLFEGVSTICQINCSDTNLLILKYVNSI